MSQVGSVGLQSQYNVRHQEYLRQLRNQETQRVQRNEEQRQTEQRRSAEAIARARRLELDRGQNVDASA